MFYYIGITALCFFAAVGIICVVRTVCDYIVIRRLRVTCSVIVESSPDKSETEYAIRLFESCIERRQFFGSVCCIKLSNVIPVDSSELKKLKAEFRNIID